MTQYTYNRKEIDVPQEVKGVLQDLETDLGDSSYKNSRKNILGYIKYINDSNGQFPTEDNPEQHVRLLDSFLNHRKKEGYARETISGHWTWLSRLYQELSMDLLNEYAFLSTNPIELLEERTGKTRKDYLPDERQSSKQKRQYYIDKDTLESMCESVVSPSFRNEVLLRLAWTTGLRGSEIVNLKEDNVNLEEGILENVEIPKTNDRTDMWIPEKTVWFLDQYLNAGYRDSFGYAQDSEYLFPTNRQEHMHSQAPNRIVKEIAEKIGIQEVLGTDKSGSEICKVTMHAMRRGHGMYLWKQGQTLKTISHRLNHSSTEQTEEYLPISVEESKQQLQDVSF
jgi:integrase/recombinase XerD